MAKTPRPPDFFLRSMNKINGVKSTKIGAAWINAGPEGDIQNINLVLDRGVRLVSSPSMVYTLFPNLPFEPQKKVPAPSENDQPPENLENPS